MPGQVTEQRKEMRSVNRARTNRKKLIALMPVCVCELKEQPCLTNSEKNHTLKSYFGP